jgi:2-C-methyl-D-erythritol 2,4-cyclodiphosphate synthase
MRIGHGFDVHKFSGKGPIRLGGVDIEHPQGLMAHSDGDVLIHALCDALIGAMGEGDIGQWFPDTDPAFANIDSGLLLQQVVTKMRANNFHLANADITVIAQTPKMAPHIASIRATLADICNSPQNAINVKATTTEGLGYTGRNEGIAVHAVVLIQSDE